jgi:indole-3-glycerol phosphate synthase
MAAEIGFLHRKGEAVRAWRRATAPTGKERQTLIRKARARPAPPSFSEALNRGGTVAVIAEFKRRSPRHPELAVGQEPATVARHYVAGGAAALSVLTDHPDFGGSLEDLAAVARDTPRPVLRKDFIIDEAGVWEARAAGAAAVLLIVRLLTEQELVSLSATAAEAGLDALVEVHDRPELERAIAAGAQLVGINNRDLESLTTDLAVTERLAPLLPPGITPVSESGLATPDDVARVRDAGARAVLVGEALLRLEPRARAAHLHTLAGVPR